MASARKKQDEKNLKIVRELVSLPPNKFCFDCSQRGPTYVNVTIGSFVCTKCSGLLRGLTPPHRVKSISMTTFTTEEVELMRSRGNDYCRRVWLGLHDGKLGANGSAWDEHAVHQHMLDKYERKRFYIEPSVSSTMANNVPTASVQHNNQLNNTLHSENNTQQAIASTTILRPPPMQKNLYSNNFNKIILRNGLSHAHRSRTTSSSSASQQQHLDNEDFVADFDHADIFSSNINTIVNGNAHNYGISNGNSMDTGFANFDNNPTFKNASFPLASSSNGSASHIRTPPPPPVAEDKYAALKDLDESLHQSNNSQPTTGVTGIDWGGSTSSLYSSATSPLSSSYGSPTTAPHFNPFNSNGFRTTSTNGSHPQNDMWSSNAFEQHLAAVSKQQQHQKSLFPSQPSALGTSMLNGNFHASNGQASLFGAGAHGTASSANPFGISGNGGFMTSFPALSSNMSSANLINNGINGNRANDANAAVNNTSWNCQNPFKLTSNGNTKNPFL